PDTARAAPAMAETGPADPTARTELSGPDRPAQEAPRPAQPAPQLADAPRPAMRTMAEALHRASDGSVELTLSPEELGRVRLTLNPGDGAITVTINADRGETMDLMRRHADLLNSAMRELGYGEVVLDFAGKGTGRQPAPQADAGAAGPGDDAAPHAAAPAPSPRPAADGSLDLRL
ncbi:MAG: flagellar hook-length control protein FliK, partial [Rhodovulum sp.]